MTTATETAIRPLIGKPITKGNVALFPLFRPGHPDSTHIASHRDHPLVISEMPSPSVPFLRAFNPHEVAVVIFAGEVVVGGFQQRVLNRTVIVRPGGSVDLEVSCVEAGRWRGRGEFGDDRAVAPMNIRHAAARGDQDDVWDNVSEVLFARGLGHQTTDYFQIRAALTSEPDSMRDEFDPELARLRSVIDEVAALGPLNGQTGYAATIGNKVVQAEIFGQSKYLSAAWEDLSESIFLSRGVVLNPTRRASVADRVLEFLGAFDRLTPESPVAGDATGSYFVASNRRAVARLVLDDNTLVHGFISAA
ncbi:MAG: ARPP-1 family domain-containing protein [Actinomycetota bacterium]